MPPDPLPRRVRLFFVVITEFPTTNTIKLSGIILVYATGAFLALASMQSADISEGVLAIWLGAPLTMMGIAQWATKIKRENPWPSTPGAQDVEDVASTRGSAATQGQPAKPVLTREDAQRAADAYAEAPVLSQLRPDD